MADKILLCISATQAIVAHTRGRRRGLAHCEIFQADEEGLAAFGTFLAAIAAASPALVYLSADAVEEDYRYETLPHATGADRSGMLERKLKQYYRNTPYVAAIARGRAGEKRRDDRYLFAALTNAALIEPWLGVIAKCALPVAGIYLASMQTAALVRALGQDLSRVLVVAPHRSGLRLTFYKDGEFCISRLSRGGAGNDAASAYAAEISNTRAYLSSLQLDSTDDVLTVLFLDHDDSLAPVVAHVAADNHLQCIRIDRATLIRRLRMAPEHLALALETGYLGLMAEKAPGANLAPASVTAGHRQFQRRNAVYAASATLALTALAWSGYNLWLAHDFSEQTAQAAKLTAATQTQYREITREFPAAPTTSENLINAVEVYKKVSKNIRSPQPFMQIVSRAVEPSPEVFLQELHWAYSATVIVAGDAAPPAQPSAAAESSAGLRQSGYFTGEIRPFQGDYRAAIEAIDAVARRLARDPAIADVRVVKYPLNVNPGLALSGNTRDNAEQSGVADFKIMLTLKPDA
jgi:hypothetical protein